MKYEYKIVNFTEKEFVSAKVKWQALEDSLNSMGQQGWDIQDIQPQALGGSGTGVVVFMKRQVE